MPTDFHALWLMITHYLAANSFLAGGGILAIGGLLLQRLRSVPNQFFAWVHKMLYYTIIVESTESLYDVLLKLQINKLIHKRNAKSFRASIDNFNDDSILNILPNRNSHFFGGFYKLCPYWVKITDPRMGADDNATSQAQEAVLKGMKPSTCELSFFSFSRNIPIQFMQDVVAAEKQLRIDEKHTGVYTSSDGSWNYRYIRSRAINTLEYNFDVNVIVDDCTNFFNSEKWYHSRSIPYRRGLMLSGPPGNGKTNMIIALANEVNKPIYFLQITENLSIERLNSLLGEVEDGSLLVIEDIDAAFNGRESLGHKVSFSAFINAIDGVIAGSGIYLVMTSNHPDKLDPALVRPGRIDKSVRVENATADQAGKYFLKFYNGTEVADSSRQPLVIDMDLVTQFEKLVGEGKYSMAMLQGHLMTYRDDPAKAVVSPITCEVNETKVVNDNPDIEAMINAKMNTRFKNQPPRSTKIKVDPKKAKAPRPRKVKNAGRTVTTGNGKKYTIDKDGRYIEKK